MSLLMGSSKKCRTLLSAMTLLLVCAQLCFAKDSSGVRTALRATGLSETQIAVVLKKIDRTYSKEDVDNHIRWLQNHGFYGRDKLVQALPIVLPQSIEGDLGTKLSWFKNQGVQDVNALIELSPDLLEGSIQGELEPKVAWLKQQGIKDVKKFIHAFPNIFVHFIKDDLNAKLSEFHKQWGIGIAEIEKSPELMGASLIRVQSLRGFLDSVAGLAGDSQYDLKSLTLEQRKVFLRHGTANQVLDSLLDVKAIASDKARKARTAERKGVGLSSLAPSDRKIMIQLYREGKFQDLLIHIADSKGAVPLKHKEIASYVESLRLGKSSVDQGADLEAFLKQEGFAYIERKQIIEHEPGRKSAYSVSSVKDQLDWYKKQGLTTTEEFTRALMTLARYPIKTDLEPKLDLLKKAGLKNAGSLLHSSPETLARSLKDLQDKLEWVGKQGSTDVKKLLNTWPHFLKLSLEENLKPTVEWLQMQGVTDIGKVINAQPGLLGLSLEENLKPKGGWLKSLGVEEMGKVIGTSPRVLTLSLEETLRPRVEWFQEQGVQNIGKMIDSFPPVLGYPIENNNETLLWLKKQGVQDIGKLLGSFPQVISYSVTDKLDPKAKWLKKNFKDIGKVISSFPPILGLAIEDNLEPKLDEFKTHWGINVAELEKTPTLMIASNSSMKELRLFLDDIAKLGGDTHFDLKKLSLDQRKLMVQKVKANDVFEKLKQTGAIGSERRSLAELTSSERALVAGLYREGDLMQKLFSRGSSPKTLQPVTCHVNFLKQKLNIK